MKKIKLALLSTIALLVFVATVATPFIILPPNIDVSVIEKPAPADYRNAYILPENQTEVWINRTIYVSEYLFTKIRDEINVSNTKSRPFSAIQIYYDRNFWEKSLTIRVMGRYKNEKPRYLAYYIHYVSSDYIGITVGFYNYLTKYDSSEKNTFRVIILFEFVGIVKVKPFGDKIGLFLNITPCPFLPYSVKEIYIRAITPEDASLEEKEAKPEGLHGIVGSDVKFVCRDVPPMNFSLGLKDQLNHYKFGSNISVVWSTNKPPISITYARRIIEISQSYEIKVEDTVLVSMYSIEKPIEYVDKNKWKLDSFRIGLAPNVSKIDEVRDNVGKIKYDNATDKDIKSSIKTIKVLFSRPLIAGEVRNVTIKYTIKLNERFIGKNNVFNISMPQAPVVNTSLLMVSLKVRTYVPLTIRLIAKTNYSQVISESGLEKFLLVSYRSVTMVLNDVCPSINGYMLLMFRYSPLYIVRTYALLAVYVAMISILIAEIGLALKVLIPRFIAPAERERIKIMEQFIRAYETLIAYDKSTWVDAYNNFVIKRPTASFIDDYRTKSTNIVRQYEKLVPVIKKLKEYAEIYDYLVELEKLEERINVIKQILISIASDFIAGKIEAEIFRSRSEALLLELKDYLNNRERIIGYIRDFYLTKTSPV